MRAPPPPPPSATPKPLYVFRFFPGVLRPTPPGVSLLAPLSTPPPPKRPKSPRFANGFHPHLNPSHRGFNPGGRRGRKRGRGKGSPGTHGPGKGGRDPPFWPPAPLGGKARPHPPLGSAKRPPRGGPKRRYPRRKALKGANAPGEPGPKRVFRLRGLGPPKGPRVRPRPPPGKGVWGKRPGGGLGGPRPPGGPAPRGDSRPPKGADPPRTAGLEWGGRDDLKKKKDRRRTRWVSKKTPGENEYKNDGERNPEGPFKRGLPLGEMGFPRWFFFPPWGRVFFPPPGQQTPGPGGRGQTPPWGGGNFPPRLPPRPGGRGLGP